MRKRGSIVGYQFENFTSLLLSLAFILLFVVIVVVLYNAFFGTEECVNEAEWGILESTLKNLESGSRKSMQIPFYNEDCSLVAFNKGQVLGIGAGSSEILTDEPQLCLCKIENNKCQPFQCYKFTKYKKVGFPREDAQFTTKGQKEQMFLTFEDKGSELEISILAVTKTEDEFVYKKDYNVDPSGLLNSLKITYSSQNSIEVTGVTIKDRPVLVDERMENLGDVLPFYFDINFKIHAPDGTETTLEEVKKMNMEIWLTNKEANLLNGKTPFLFYETQEGDWDGIDLQCDFSRKSGVDLSRVIPCSTTLTTFAQHFAVSAGVVHE